VEAGAAAERRMAGREEAALAEMGLAEADRGSRSRQVAVASPGRVCDCRLLTDWVPHNINYTKVGNLIACKVGPIITCDESQASNKLRVRL
jgi:hypothetical protein